ncbi:MAG: OmpA family protein [Desulfamplus sp.]|nr:OmpA family protein [Desulfamplus sp.]
MNYKNSVFINKVIIIIVSLAAILALAGCGTKSMVVILPNPDGNVGQVVVSTDSGEQLLSEANQSVQARGKAASLSKVKVLSDGEIKSTFSEALAAQPMVPDQFVLYFLHNSDTLTPESNAVIPEIIQTIQKRGTPDIIISGHTDTVGSMDYNYKLALERAEVMYKILVDKGVAPTNIVVTSHGEGNPLVKTDDNVEEPKNRRVEVVIK